MTTQERIGTDAELQMLSCIVEAMLAAEPELQVADGDQWCRILVDSCREQKLSTHTSPWAGTL